MSFLTNLSSNFIDSNMFSAVTIGHPLAKRLAEEPLPKFELPDFFQFLLLGDFILFLPVLVIVSLSRGHFVTEPPD